MWSNYSKGHNFSGLMMGILKKILEITRNRQGNVRYKATVAPRIPGQKATEIVPVS